jgi:pimeloyl-ACP methyl ester carboxylesterase
MPNRPTIAFAHGIWADGSCFNKVMAPLVADGYDVIASQHSMDTAQGDIDTCIATFNRVDGPIVLVGHSYGGTVITGAGVDERVAALVYICALACDETETSESLQAKFPTTDVFQRIDVADGRVWMRPDGIECFCGDLPVAEQKLIWATAAPPAATLFAEKVPGVAWKERPSWYIVGANDRSVHPELERFVAKRMGADTTELQSSHCPMLSQPDRVVEVIRKAAASV